MSYVAFFDLDKTILKINSGSILFKMAHKNGILSSKQIYSAYFLGIMHKLSLIDALRIIELFPVWLKDYSVRDFETLCQDVVEKELIQTIRPQMIEEIEKHKDQGAKLVMLSATITSICHPIAKHLGIPHVLCSELENDGHNYSGNSVGKLCFREEKLERMNQFLQQNNFPLKDAYYYGDSIDDLPVLQSIENPICIHPDKKLKRIAIKNKWTIHTWDS